MTMQIQINDIVRDATPEEIAKIEKERLDAAASATSEAALPSK
jgi:hypothetical protein